MSCCGQSVSQYRGFGAPWQDSLDLMVSSLRSASRELSAAKFKDFMTPGFREDVSSTYDIAIQTVDSAADTLDRDMRSQLEAGGTVHGSFEATWAVAVDLWKSANESAASTLKWDQADKYGVLDAIRDTLNNLGQKITSGPPTWMIVTGVSVAGLLALGYLSPLIKAFAPKRKYAGYRRSKR